MWVCNVELAAAIYVEVAEQQEAHGPREQKREEVVNLELLLDFAVDVAVAFES